uniref:Cytochrome c oxidase subunit 2 n=1 Tax=Parakontikia atrata TaxID=2903269 RepID=A0A9E7V7Z5_9PLAT|nr:cytochrome c oxidase subunit II [Parakontikia atrata]UZA66415.1 cytochrome c oxidase subunit 2 [Parakontikia atrata]
MVASVSIPMMDYHTFVGVNLDQIYDYAMAIAYGISFFVFLMLLFYMLNSYVFNNFIENKALEFIWTTVPGGILVSLLLPSVRGLYSLDYTRYNKVNMNVVVSGRQWYWSYKFLPRANKVSTCSECTNGFGVADKQHYFFQSSSAASNALMPFWSDKLRESSYNLDYIMGRAGRSEVFRLPTRLYNSLYKESEYLKMNEINEAVNHCLLHLGYKYYGIKPSDYVIRLTESETSNLYNSNWLDPIYLLRKINKIYEVDSYMTSNTSNIGSFRNLDVEIPLLAPIRKLIRFFFWSSDVIHSFAIPDLSIKLDCVPGRLNSAYTVVPHVGKFYGQCSELCGANHSFMPSSLETYIQNTTICFNHHYLPNYSGRWEENFFVRSTLGRLQGLICYPIFLLGWQLGLVHCPSLEESYPLDNLCPICTWLIKFLFSFILVNK